MKSASKKKAKKGTYLNKTFLANEKSLLSRQIVRFNVFLYQVDPSHISRI